jgi:hypothetical protein
MTVPHPFREMEPPRPSRLRVTMSTRPCASPVGLVSVSPSAETKRPLPSKLTFPGLRLPSRPVISTQVL